MSCIGLGKIDKNLIPIIVGCIFCFLNRLINQYDKTLLFKNPIITNFFDSFSRFLAVIPYIILKIRSKRINNKNIQNINNNNSFISLYKKNNKDEIVRYKAGFILLTAITFLIQSVLFVETFKIKTNSWIWYIFIATLFYYLIFKIKLYNHHYLSIILIILLGFVIDIILGNIQNELINNLGLLLIRFIREILISLYNVVAKYTMEKKYVSVYELSFYIGLINMILFGIFSIFDYNFFKLYDYEIYFNNFNYIELLVLLGVIFTQLGINLSTLITNRNNSPCHIFIILVFGQIAYYMNFSGYSIIVIIFLIIILFLSLVFNEIIEINICRLSYNTRRNISKRAEFEDFLIKQNQVNDENVIVGKDGYLFELNSDNDKSANLENE